MNRMQFDVVVVGGGHAGAEAAAAAAKLGAETLLITMNIDTICQMSCNPAMGGVAKGQIVREIDALGGMSGIVTDRSMIQFRMLNLSKGPAMWSPRAQCDKMQFSLNWRKVLENTPHLSIWQDEVIDVIIDGGVVQGVRTRLGLDILSKAVILTNGTFLNGIIYIGDKSWSGGRIGERPAQGLSDSLHAYGFAVDRLKTGTPVRIDGRTINFEKLVEQPGDENPQTFSYLNTHSLTRQRSCYLAYTNLGTHEILRTGFDRSPLYTGRIQGHGPRYCPSIEDKIVRFAGKDRHQLFVEPEGWETNSYYLNGFSSSLPLEVQVDALHTIEGFEDANDSRRGDGHYAKALAAMDLMRSYRIPFGVSICYTSRNYKDVTSDAFLDMLVEKGCVFAWYFHYMPVGMNASTDLLLTPEQRLYMKDRIRWIRGIESGKELFAIDFQNDGEFVSGCVAGGKYYCHINAAGDVEPCVFIHYSGANVNEMSFLDCLKQPLFMAYHDNQPFNENHLRPCPMLENPEILQRLVKETGAHSTDLEAPESVEHLCGKCDLYAEKWAPVAEEVWKEDHGTEEKA